MSEVSPPLRVMTLGRASSKSLTLSKPPLALRVAHVCGKHGLQTTTPGRLRAANVARLRACLASGPRVMPENPLSIRRLPLLSRITSPFTTKSRNITDFHIEVDDPHKQHSPGDQVRGNVRLSVQKPTRLTHLVVCLHGYVQVYKTPGSPPSEGYRVNGQHAVSGRGSSKSGEYFGNGFATLFTDEVPLCGEGRLGEGAYKFEFLLEFPDADLPSSISVRLPLHRVVLA